MIGYGSFLFSSWENWFCFIDFLEITLRVSMCAGLFYQKSTFLGDANIMREPGYTHARVVIAVSSLPQQTPNGVRSNGVRERDVKIWGLRSAQ